MGLVEQHHEDAMRPVLRFVRVRAGQRARRLPQVVRDHEELLDLLRLAVFQQRDVLDLQTGNEVAVLVEDDGVDFDEGGGRLERGLLAGRADGAHGQQGDQHTQREPHGSH